MKKIFILHVILISLLGKAQQSLDSLRYVDFHIHTSMKNYYREVPHPDSMKSTSFTESIRNSNWDGKKHRSKFKNKKDFSGFWGKTSYPQASFDLLNSGKASILCTSITPLEKLTVSNRKVRMSIFGLLGIKMPIRKINHKLVTRLHMNRLKTIDDPKNNAFNEFLGEYKFLINQDIHSQQRSIKLVKDKTELLDARKKGITALVLSLEGGHILYGPINTSNYNNYSFDRIHFEEILKNIDIIKNLPHRVLFISPSHLAWNKVAGFAKAFDADGMKRGLLRYNSRKVSFREALFQKEQQGFYDTVYRMASKNERKEMVNNKEIGNCDCAIKEPLETNGKGFDIIKAFLDTNNLHRKPLLVDMRHMDVLARREYINYIKNLRDKNIHIPIIISHAAVNGKSESMAQYFGLCPVFDQYEEIENPEKFYKLHSLPNKYNCAIKFNTPNINEFIKNKGGWFHPWSINLFDEEILEVFKSKGIIGITFEERVLGKDRINYSKSYYKELENKLKLLGYTTNEIITYKKAEPFIRNLMYIVETADTTEKSWDIVAIGSDFDGIINPIDVCTSADQIPNFYKILQKHLYTFGLINEKTHLFYNKPIEVLLNKLLYQNGERFIIENM